MRTTRRKTALGKRKDKQPLTRARLALGGLWWRYGVWARRKIGKPEYMQDVDVDAIASRGTGRARGGKTVEGRNEGEAVEASRPTSVKMSCQAREVRHETATNDPARPGKRGGYRGPNRLNNKQPGRRAKAPGEKRSKALTGDWPVVCVFGFFGQRITQKGEGREGGRKRERSWTRCKPLIWPASGGHHTVQRRSDVEKKKKKKKKIGRLDGGRGRETLVRLEAKHSRKRAVRRGSELAVTTIKGGARGPEREGGERLILGASLAALGKNQEGRG